MDKFKAVMNRRCDVGGLKCSCCNSWKNDKQPLRRIARRVLKQLFKKEIRGINTEYE